MSRAPEVACPVSSQVAPVFLVTKNKVFAMNFDDAIIDSTLWACIEKSRNPDDFKAYIEHCPSNAAHLADAAARLEELGNTLCNSTSLFPEAVACIQALASAGNVVAQFHMGKFYDVGRGVAEDYVSAARWYELAASKGEPRAAHNLANLKLAGESVPQDIDGAIALYEIGMAAGDPLGAETLGRFFLHGQHRDIEKAVGFLRRAYELGSPSAGMRLAKTLYDEATSASQRDEAKALLFSLVEQNYHPAAKTLAYIYTEAHSSDRDYEAAKLIYLKLLESGQQESMLALGHLDSRTPPATNETGRDLLHWYRKAWDAGLYEAAGYIGRAYLDGEGVEKSIEEALRWFMLGAEKGESGCAYLAGTLLETRVNGSDSSAEPWYRQAAEAGVASAQIALARLLVRDTGIPLDGTEAVKWLNMAIAGGSAEAMLLLAHLYQNGMGVIKNEKAAFELCHRAALAGNLVGQSELGWRLSQGIGCDVNLEEGVSWHRRAAMSGRAYDQGILAYLYLYGQQPFEQNHDEAIKWARLSATQNDELGQFVLGICYYHGCSVSKDLSQACDWLTKAAEQGHALAQVKLAEHFYTGGYGNDRDFLMAGHWASQAADAGHPAAQLLLGRMFLFGEQVERDPKVAFEWLSLAASQREPEAMFWLGHLAAEGVGTKRDWMIALKWLKKAADAGVEAAVKSLKSYGIDYTPGSQNKHRLSPDDPVVLDTDYEVQQFDGQWECDVDERKASYCIRSDGTFSSVLEMGMAEPMTSSGRWAVRGAQLIWDVWESNMPVEDPETMDDRIAFLSEDELHLLGGDGNIHKFRKVASPASPGNSRIIHFSKLRKKLLN